MRRARPRWCRASTARSGRWPTPPAAPWASAVPAPASEFLTRFLAARAGLAPDRYTLLPVGTGAGLVAALRQDRVQFGIATEPALSQLQKSRAARVLVDLRTPHATRAALGGAYPTASFYMESAYVRHHAEIVQKLANAWVRTLGFIHEHSAAEIADALPHGVVGSDAGAIEVLAAIKAAFSADGVMPAGGPETVLRVLVAAMPELAPRRVDLSQTYTTEFARHAK